MTLTKKRTKPRRTTSPRCETQRCKKPAKIEGRCITHAEREADRLFSLWIRDRDQRCTYADLMGASDCKGPLQAAHVYSRRYMATRYNPANVHALCAGHHLMVDTHQAHKDEWAIARIGVAMFDILRSASIAGLSRVESVTAALEWLS